MLKSHKCTVLLLFNLAEPDWISVPCDQKLLSNVACFVQVDKYMHNSKSSINIKNVKEFAFCSPGHILKGLTSYEFLWFDRVSKTRTFCQEFKTVSVNRSTTMSLKYIYISLSLQHTLQSILIEKDSERINVMEFQRTLNKLQFRYRTVHSSQAQGFYICQYEKLNISIGINLLHCTNGGYILVEHIHDGIIDCPNDKSDEDFSTYHSPCLNTTTINIYEIPFCKRNKKVCSNLYLMTKEAKCMKHKNIKSNVKKIIKITRDNIKFTCIDGKTIDRIMLNDLTFDCGSDGEDEPILRSVLINETYSSCSKPNMIPCMEGHSRCYCVRDICTYKLNVYYHLVPCRNGGHLQNCKDFECNIMFKCKDSYCITWPYVSDGKWDCPE